MTDEGQMGNPIDRVEAIAGVQNMAMLAWTLFSELRDQGFEVAQALKLVGAFLHGAGGGKLEQ